MKHFYQRLLISALLLICAILANAEEIDGIAYTLDDDTKTASVKKEYAGYYSGDVIIPETITYDNVTYTVTSIGDGAFNECKKITSVVIPNSVTSIGGYAFNRCEGLTSINIPNSVTSIGENAFWGCFRLTSIDIPNSVSFIGRNAFNYCYGLTSITIPNSITSIETGTFEDCSGLTSITIPNSITSIGVLAFHNCFGLTSITIPSSVTSIGGSVFSDCSGLTSIIVEKGNPVYDSRDNCNAIVKTQTNTLIVGCKNTIIPNSVTSIADAAFWGCTELTSITIPSSVTSIDVCAFRRCEELASITIPYSVTSIGKDAFVLCNGLTSMAVEDNNPTYDSREDCNAIIETQTNKLVAGCKNTIIPNSVTSIGDDAFWSCTGLSSIDIPSSVTSIGEDAFYDCTGLTSIYIPSSVTSIEYGAFQGCTRLNSIYCNISNPACINESAFYNIFPTVYVPVGTKEAYESRGFRNFSGTFVEMNMTGIEETTMMQTAKPTEYYNLQGQRINKPERGVVIVKYSDGTSRKVMMK